MSDGQIPLVMPLQIVCMAPTPLMFSHDFLMQAVVEVAVAPLRYIVQPHWFLIEGTGEPPCPGAKQALHVLRHLFWKLFLLHLRGLRANFRWHLAVDFVSAHVCALTAASRQAAMRSRIARISAMEYRRNPTRPPCNFSLRAGTAPRAACIP